MSKHSPSAFERRNQPPTALAPHKAGNQVPVMPQQTKAVGAKEPVVPPVPTIAKTTTAPLGPLVSEKASETGTAPNLNQVPLPQLPSVPAKEEPVTASPLPKVEKQEVATEQPTTSSADAVNK